MNPFKHLHQGPDVLVLPNAWDAGSARVVEVAGAKAIATSSAAVAWANGYPDGEATPFDLVVATVKEIARVVSLPITADVEAGYGEDPTAHVAKVIDAGAQGINIEDGKGAPDLLAAKIEKIKTRFGDTVWINARTDVYLHGLAEGEAAYDETVKRADLYRSAGADSIFIPMAVEDAVIGRFVKAIDAPLNFLAWPGLPALKRLKELGVRRLSAGSGIAKTVMNETFVLTQAFLAEGRSEPLTAPLDIPGGLNGNMRKG